MQRITVAKLGASALLTVMLAACSSTGSETEEVDTGANTSAISPVTTSGTEIQETEAQRMARETQERVVRDERVFYFDFDQSELKPEAREALVYHANHLKANPNVRVRLEGHADERGTREYNLALGERRAQSVERYLEVQGVSPNQLETISYGEERPAQNGSTEAAYAQNRRVELVYN